MKVAIRVDASERIGTGHFMRCLALANALRQRGAQTVFLCRYLPEYLSQLLLQQDHNFTLLSQINNQQLDNDLAHASWLGTSQEVDAQMSLGVLANQEIDWLVVDHYALDSRWEKTLRRCCRKILVIDDLADREHDCDLLLDQNFYHNMSDRYVGKVPEHCHFLLGPGFALLRDEFSKFHENVKVRQGPVERILVFFGGVDAENNTSLALSALVDSGCDGFKVDVVIGAHHPCPDSIEQICAQYGYSYNIQTAHMADLMAAADLAIGAGGITTWERCCMGLPSLAVITADNQRCQLADAAAAGLVYSIKIGDDIKKQFVSHLKALIENHALRQLISSNSIKIVDGRGAQRVASSMGYTGVEMREARLVDLDSIYEWRNHPKIRAVSNNAELISLKDHNIWFSSVIEDPSKRLLIGECGGTPVGVVRFDMRNEEAEVSIYLVPTVKIAGQGRDLLQAAEIWLAKNSPKVSVLRAQVIGANISSQRLFLSAGYEIDNLILCKKLA